MVDYSRDAVLTMTYEYIPTVPAGFDKVKALWFDIGGCGSSDQPAKPNQAFQYSSPGWTADFNGRITFIGGHLHDGGTHLNVKKNSTVICDCEAAYGQSPAYINGGLTSMNASMSGMSMKARAPMTMSSGMSMSGMASSTKTTISRMSGTETGTSTSMPTSTSSSMAGMSMNDDTVHISSISTCDNNANISVGDVWSITAFYNSTEYSLMTNTDGTLAPIMGISLVYVADMNLTSTAANSSGNGQTEPGASSNSGGSKVFGTNMVSVLLWGCLTVCVLGMC